MSKCLFCDNKKDGPICKHCLASGATKVGKGAKKGGKAVLTVASFVVTVIGAVTLFNNNNES